MFHNWWLGPQNSAPIFEVTHFVEEEAEGLVFALGVMFLFVANFGLLISDVCVCCIFWWVLPDFFWGFSFQ